MSWSGAVAGTTPYQPPPYANGQSAYSQQQTYQYGQHTGYAQYQSGQPYPQNTVPPRPLENRPPKKKGNPIITRYPPPPGYRGPAQPQGPYGTHQFPNQYQPTQQAYQGPPGPPTYPTQGYQAPPVVQGYPSQSYGPPQGHPQQPSYPHGSYPQAPSYHWPQQQQSPQNYAPQSAFPQPANYGNSQGYAPAQSAYQSYQAQPAAPSSTQHAWNQTQGWQQSDAPASYAPTHQYSPVGPPPTNGQATSDPNATPTPTSAHPVTNQSTPPASQLQSATSEKDIGDKPQLFLAWDDWDFDFDGAIWPKANEPVDPNLSLGVIIWRPAKQVTRALPCTFDEAEEQSLKPPAEKLGNGESVSIYFTTQNSHEAFLDVRQTDEWYRIHRDPVFVVFTDEAMARHLVPIDECVALRDRPDEPLEENRGKEDEEMHDSTWSVMDHLEQALSGNAEDEKLLRSSQDLGAKKDQTQEDILAKLGVTGSPKPPSNEPMQFSLPFDEKPVAQLPEKPSVPPQPNIPVRPEQPPQRAQSYGGHRNSTYGAPPQRPYGSMSSSIYSRPPPERQQSDPWKPLSTNIQAQSDGQAFDNSHGSPARSEGSNRTLAGSDFESEKPINAVEKDTVPIPQLKRSDSSFSRKRSYEDADQDEKVRQQDDHTKRKRRSQVDAAYSRR